MSVCKRQVEVNNAFVTNNLTQQRGMWFRVKGENSNKKIDQNSICDLFKVTNAARSKYLVVLCPLIRERLSLAYLHCQYVRVAANYLLFMRHSTEKLVFSRYRSKPILAAEKQYFPIY